MKAKIVDFGTAFALPFTPSDYYTIHTQAMQSSNENAIQILSGYCREAVGTSGYTAPEILGGEVDSKWQGCYAYPADVFSLAVVAWEIFIEDSSALNNPLQGLNPTAAYPIVSFKLTLSHVPSEETYTFVRFVDERRASTIIFCRISPAANWFS